MTERPARHGWARGLAWAGTGLVVAALTWWVTGLDILDGVVVALVALVALDGHAVTLRRSARYLAMAATLALVGAVTLGRAGIGPSTGSRLAQGAAGILAATVVLVVVAAARRHRP